MYADSLRRLVWQGQRQPAEDQRKQMANIPAGNDMHRAPQVRQAIREAAFPRSGTITAPQPRHQLQSIADGVESIAKVSGRSPCVRDT